MFKILQNSAGFFNMLVFKNTNCVYGLFVPKGKEHMVMELGLIVY